MEIVITCEHASNRVPAALRHRMHRQYSSSILESHVAYDLFSALAARRLARNLGAPLLEGRWSRLCIDLNRSLSNPSVWSRIASQMTKAERESWIKYHMEYRARAEAAIRKASIRSQVLHISVHSFTPVLKGQSRNCDIGWLYDPSRKGEVQYARWFQRQLRESGWKVRRNYPYRGIADGHTTHLRNLFVEDKYIGLELELNQSLEKDVLKVVDHLSRKLKYR
ncbi:MAG TPA: N-formylglutamate amidohydrolase [Leptospiraceae bacterium]|nr:N-formylglutamate amidohydrolase [Spirochaetaceae bacterium]HBS05170.1 N-formylglutamate amidohydrolase [Leptospiraceae bacterium]|tara:strand:- start:36595 stop:37263 length:669 start_codon:yes stop_codon:yes gene_type:complete